ncbi:unnamed protein product, partial [Musa banksii]
SQAVEGLLHCKLHQMIDLQLQVMVLEDAGNKEGSSMEEISTTVVRLNIDCPQRPHRWEQHALLQSAFEV